MSKQLDSRRHPRFAVQIKAEVATPAGDRVAATTRDMSRGGICLICPKQVAPGATLNLTLALVLGANSFSEKLSLPARVVWCTPIERDYQIGAMFSGLDRERTGYLEMFLRFLQQEVLVAGEPVSQDSAGPNAEFDTGDADKP